jgi:O-antigen/teichoic acid export membrane protein
MSVGSALRSRARALVPKGGFGHSVALIAGGGALGQLAVVLGTPILTRLYSPQAFGALAVYASLLTTLNASSSLRLEVAIPLASSDEEATDLAAAALIALFLVVGLVGVFVLGVSKRIEEVTHATGLAASLWVLPPSLFVLGVYQIHSFWRIRHREYGAIGTARLSQGVSQVLGQVSLGMAGLSPVGLLLGDCLGRTTSAVVISVRGRRVRFSDTSWIRIRNAVRRWRRFPLFSAPSSLLNSGGRHLTPFLMAVVFGPAVAGWFTLVQRVASLPYTVAGEPISQVYFAQMSQTAREGRDDARRLLRSSFRHLFLVGAIPFLLAAFVAPFVFRFIFGPSWAPAGRYLQVLAPMFLAQFVVVPLSPTLMATSRQDLQLYWDISRTLVVLVLFLAASILHWTALSTVTWFSIVMTGLYVVLGAMCVSSTAKSKDDRLLDGSMEEDRIEFIAQKNSSVDPEGE